MPPKKRKIEDTASPQDAAEVVVKTERLSQDVGENKDNPEQVEGTSIVKDDPEQVAGAPIVKDDPEQVERAQGTSIVPKIVDRKVGATRNLRPRKSTCYAEIDGPEINYEEKIKKIPRRKRRPVDGESKLQENQKDDDQGEEKKKPVQMDGEGEGKDEPLVKKVSAPIRKPTFGGRKPKSISAHSGRKEIIHKREAIDPEDKRGLEPVEKDGDQGEEQKKSVQMNGVGDGKDKPLVKRVSAPVRKPTFGGRKSKPISAHSARKEIIHKREAIDPEDIRGFESVEKDAEQEEKKKSVQLAGGDGKVEPPAKRPSAPVRKPSFGGRKSKSISDRSGRKEIQKEKAIELEDTRRFEDAEKDGEQEEAKKKLVPIDGEGDAKNPEPVKRVSAPIRKPTFRVRKSKSISARSGRKEIIHKEEAIDQEDKQGLEKAEKNGAQEEEKKKSVPMDGEGEGKDQPLVKKVSAPIRKPTFRGRRSKSISARSGRKEIIHTEEAIDPEDIRGFEHVEKYVTPPGVRLPKFWDSEDEVSEDESNDNFRRIMCGFGTNCRIHEVIRPASEIVRRLKELQNTFGATKTLPLFQKDEFDPNEDALISTSTEPFFRQDKDRTLNWHTDPSFFKYANNYPSKCK